MVETNLTLSSVSNTLAWFLAVFLNRWLEVTIGKHEMTSGSTLQQTLY